MPTDIFMLVDRWYSSGLPSQGLSSAQRAAVIENAQCSYLAEHVGLSESELQKLDDAELVRVTYGAMVDAAR